MSDAHNAAPSAEQLQALGAQIVGFVTHMAGVPQQKAAQALAVQEAVDQQLGPFIESLMDEEARQKYPMMGVRLHWPDGKTRTDLVVPKVLSSRAQETLGLRAEDRDHGSDLGTYALVVCAVTSPIGRAILGAQGYRIEFLQAPLPRSPLLL